MTGAGRGIGKAVALRLSSQGHSVGITARSRDELESLAGEMRGPSCIVAADITAAGAVDEVFAGVESALGPIEVLVANAGAATSAPIARITDEAWSQMLDVNLTAPFRCLRRAVPSMVEHGYGRIVVVASVASKRGEPYTAAYTAAKHGVLGLVRSAAAELATKGVTVNAVCPAFVDSPMTDGTVASVAGQTGRPEEEIRRLLASQQPIGRLIRPEEVAVVVSHFLDSPAVTGQGWNIDGGAVQS